VIATLTVLVACNGERKSASAPPAPVAAAPRDAAAPSPSPDAIAIRWLRSEVHLEAGDVPFFLGLEVTGSRGFIVSDEERLDVVIEQRDPIVVRIPVRGATLRLARDVSGAYKGEWDGEYYWKKKFAVTATEIPEPRRDLLFPGTEPPAADLTGVWRVELKTFGLSRADLTMSKDGTLDGTFTSPNVGDMRYLSGRVIGNRFALSVFDGMHCFLVEGTISKRGDELRGRWVISVLGAFEFTATRGNAPDVTSLLEAHLKRGKKRITLPALDQPPYKGNPVIVDFFGTWCPACIDLTPELARLQRTYGPQGLQILSIALEPDGDRKELEHRLDEFKRIYGVTWEIEIRQADDFLSGVPPELEGVEGFPISVFIRRDGTVAAVHTGFVSPAIASSHKAVVDHYENLTRQILAR
jgi:thiol-disulfide isomerase/thioredoxin